ncbi:MAG: KpsF/GutQ family sugar-phosphate isomerase [Candidatus Zophobacter franzmannii]|nr:KpsF/GutQ family sugar-phosphate isomerase [Candidatus Zophobacter franzmannii]
MNIIETLKNEMLLEAKAVTKATEYIDSHAEDAFNLILNCKGKVVLTGMGKTGIIARKISATLASTGTTSIFLHAAEGIHGDLGMLKKEDVVIAISYSGNTKEVLDLIPYIKFLKIPLISITGKLESQLALASDAVINGTVPLEYEPLGLVPTSSTTVALAIGDALAIALLRARNFEEKDYAQFHPGGTIGKKLLLRVKDLMHKGDDLPIVNADTMMYEAISVMTEKKLGCTTVIEENGTMIGIITDGDLRRILQKRKGEIIELLAIELMTHNPVNVDSEMLAVEALNIMENHNITMLPVVNTKDQPVGLLHMHDLIKAGVVG